MIHSLAVCFLRTTRCGEFKVCAEIIEAFTVLYVPGAAAFHAQGVPPLQILFLVRGQTVKGCSDCIGVNLMPDDLRHIIRFLTGKLFQYIPFFLLVIQEDCLLPVVQAVGFPKKSVCGFSPALEFLHEGFHRVFQIVLHPRGSADFLVGGQRR